MSEKSNLKNELSDCLVDDSGHHNLLVIRSQETSDHEGTRTYWSATQVLCEKCFRIFDVRQIEDFK